MERPEDRAERIRKLKRLENKRTSNVRWREKKYRAKRQKIKYDKRLLYDRNYKRKIRADKLGLSLEVYIEKYAKPEPSN